jgi:predicted transcriptional regulator
MIHLSEFHAKVFFMVRRVGPVTPTRLGLHFQFELDAASGHMRRPLKKLVELGLVERVAVNKRVVRYKSAHDIVPPMVIKNDPEGLIYEKLKHEDA